MLAAIASPLAASAQTCKQFASCAEAVKSWKSGNTKLDGDGDGIPCEKICGKNGENMPGSK
ncbi:excalibur calcium-binding domain-containing protein [Vulcanococcus limneticus]|uniref:excalibur calcium-binding domain-containing protein n=1 Tax=Vulcanococcus limneticus TaxID=2170428 RepID=UPI00398BFC12